MLAQQQPHWPFATGFLYMIEAPCVQALLDDGILEVDAVVVIPQGRPVILRKVRKNRALRLEPLNLLVAADGVLAMTLYRRTACIESFGVNSADDGIGIVSAEEWVNLLKFVEKVVIVVNGVLCHVLDPQDERRRSLRCDITDALGAHALCALDG